MKRLMFKNRPTSGFTIVEQLIVIGIIVILAAIATLAYVSVQKDSRDRAREADVVAIMNALEEYYEKNGEYPANDQINTTNSPTLLSSYTATKTLLPDLKDENLDGPDGYHFYAGCINTSCTNTSANWDTYHSKAYYYSSRLVASAAGQNVYFETSASYGNNKGWGCRITTYYDDPGYFIAWRSEVTGLWTFKRSIRGQVTIANYGTGPVAPQTCTFS